MIRILFVDNNPHILDGIRRSVHGMRGERQMRFCNGGDAALSKLAEQPADVIVADTRMPEMDGADLLGEVKRHHPEAIRIVLSGHAEPDSMIRATASAHRCLSKPCEASTLKATIARTHEPEGSSER